MYKAYEIDSLIKSHSQSLTRAISSAQDGKLVVRLSNAVLAMFDAACWFAGLRSGLSKMKTADQNTFSGAVITACEKIQSDLKSFRDSLNEIDGTSPDVSERCSDAKESAALLFEELELLRWDAMEWQADEDIDAGKVSAPFTSTAQLLGSLRH